MIHMPEVLTIMFSAGNFGRAYDESLADFFLGSMGYLTFGHLIHLIISAGVPSTAGLAKHTLPTGALADASIASDGFLEKWMGRTAVFFAMKMMEVPCAFYVATFCLHLCWSILGMDHSTFVRSFWHCNLQSQSLPCEALTS
jgi:hypothetical protein